MGQPVSDTVLLKKPVKAQKPRTVQFRPAHGAPRPPGKGVARMAPEVDVKEQCIDNGSVRPA
ncbi:hypothetical protein SAMN05443635_12110 [Roseobacter denitrificans OCh 114]|nr:hypothetical protein SAMN05443635_12110 [Roseobacter denitrificans OCh 114]